jgi:hypothetical protein
VTSQRKINANRRNARKHGLSIPITAERGLHADALKIARAIAGEGAGNALMEQAIIVAETELQLQRIKQARLTALEMEMRQVGPNSLAAGGAMDATSPRTAASSNEVESLAGAVVRAMPILKQIERYERRVYSRRAKAIICLNGLRAMAQCSAKRINNQS